MSHCRQNDDCNCNCGCNCGCNCERQGDCWFNCEPKCPRPFPPCINRPIFPTVLQASLIIPQTVIPIRIVVNPTPTPFVSPIVSPLISPIASPIFAQQNGAFGAAVPFDPNLLAGNGIYTGF